MDPLSAGALTPVAVGLTLAPWVRRPDKCSSKLSVSPRRSASRSHSNCSRASLTRRSRRPGRKTSARAPFAVRAAPTAKRLRRGSARRPPRRAPHTRSAPARDQRRPFAPVAPASSGSILGHEQIDDQRVAHRRPVARHTPIAVATSTTVSNVSGSDFRQRSEGRDANGNTAGIRIPCFCSPGLARPAKSGDRLRDQGVAGSNPVFPAGTSSAHTSPTLMGTTKTPRTICGTCPCSSNAGLQRWTPTPRSTPTPISSSRTCTRARS